MEFSELGLKEPLLQAVTELGFKSPMPIQEAAIPMLLAEKIPDFIGLAQTGTGKTCAYGLPLLQHIDAGSNATQGLILCPTRELCLQIGEELVRFSKYMKSVHTVAVYGGASIEQQIYKLRRGAQIIVATPGRLNDMIRRGAVDLTAVTITILDEADEMLDMGFQEELNAILETIPTEQSATWLFSATMAPEVEQIARRYLKEPQRVTIGSKNEAGANIAHHAYKIVDRKRYECLRRIIDYTPEMFGLVFCRTRHDTQLLSEQLMHEGIYAEALHGDLSQAQRDTVMRKFRSHAVKILCATDVAARGLDVDDITHVIHYHLPDDVAVYTHRSGRTARAGKSGVSIVLAGPRELSRIRIVERMCGIRFEQRQIPSADDVRQRHMFRLVEELQEVGESIHPEIKAMLPALIPTLAELSPEAILERILELRLRPLMIAYENAPDLNPGPRPSTDRSLRGERATGEDRQPRETHEMQRIMINVGRLDHLKEGAIVRIACETGNIEASQIGSIDIKREFAFFDVWKEYAEQVVVGLTAADFDGKPIAARLVDNSPKPRPKKPRHPYPNSSFKKNKDKGRGRGDSRSEGRGRGRREDRGRDRH